MRRTKAQRAAAKKLLKKPAGRLEPIDLSSCDHPKWMTRAYKNNRYVVMIDDNCMMTGGITAVKTMVQRHDGRPITNHWKEMQSIKNAIFGADATAIEYYPSEYELTDIANIYWMFVFHEGVIPKPVRSE